MGAPHAFWSNICLQWSTVPCPPRRIQLLHPMWWVCISFRQVMRGIRKKIFIFTRKFYKLHTSLAFPSGTTHGRENILERRSSRQLLVKGNQSGEVPELVLWVNVLLRLSGTFDALKGFKTILWREASISWLYFDLLILLTTSMSM